MLTKTKKGWIIENERFYEGSKVECFDSKEQAYERLKDFVRWRETNGILLDETCECGWNIYCRMNHIVMGPLTNKNACSEISRIYTKDDIIEALSAWITVDIKKSMIRERESDDDFCPFT
jgi:hypothetical protein